MSETKLDQFYTSKNPIKNIHLQFITSRIPLVRVIASKDTKSMLNYHELIFAFKALDSSRSNSSKNNADSEGVN